MSLSGNINHVKLNLYYAIENMLLWTHQVVESKRKPYLGNAMDPSFRAWMVMSLGVRFFR